MPLEHPVAINGVNYPVDAWETVGQGRVLRKRWRYGFQRMGTWYDGSEQEDAFEYYQGENMDMASYPEARLRPIYAASIGATGLDVVTNPVYFMRAESPGGTAYVFVFNGTKIFKIKTSNNTLADTLTFAGEKCGRPVMFEGKIHLPMGPGKEARRLDLINDDATDDTWTQLGSSTDNALHFTTRMVNGQAQIIGAFQPNLVKFSTDGTTFSPGNGFEVGDSTLAITDMLQWQGETAVINPANVYRFGEFSESIPLQDFIGKTDSPALKDDDGANSLVYGPFLYWVNTSAFGRFVGNGYLPVGPEDTPTWIDKQLGLDAEYDGPWYSATAYGRWLYATKTGTSQVFGTGGMLLQGFINEDGTLDWQGRIIASDRMRVGITEGPILWIADNAGPTIRRLSLKQDGSMKTKTGINRGAASESAKLYLPNIDFGLGGDRRFQLSRFAMLLRDGDAEASYQLKVIRDEGSEENVGDPITADGETSNYTERSWTAGTADLARMVQPLVVCTLSSGYAPTTNDPRIRGLYIEARSPEVYRARIPLTDDAIAEAGLTLSIGDALKNLHDLRGKPAVEIREPGMASTFSGHIVGIEEKFSDRGKEVSVLIERYDWSYAK